MNTFPILRGIYSFTRAHARTHNTHACTHMPAHTCTHTNIYNSTLTRNSVVVHHLHFFDGCARKEICPSSVMEFILCILEQELFFVGNAEFNTVIYVCILHYLLFVLLFCFVLFYI